MQEDAEARWARWESGEYAEDPETKLLILMERWHAAKDDPYARGRVALRAAVWLLEELSECVRLGRSYLLVAPNPDDSPLGPYHELVGLFHWRIQECLRRAVAMAEHSREAMSMELQAAADIACKHYSRVFSAPSDLEDIRYHVELLTKRLSRNSSAS